MKKIRKIIILGAFLLLLLPLFHARADNFKAATLFKGDYRVAVYTKNDADSYFKLGYKLEIKNNEFKLGVAIPLAVANFETSLQAALSATATSTMTLVNGTTDDGTTLSGTYGFVINSGSTNQEYILADCVNTACTNLVRGISVVTGNTSIPALQSYHLRGASVKITDHPILITLSRILSGLETTPGGLTFGTNSITGLATPNAASSTSAANVDYVNTSVTSGAPVASETSKGISELATQAEMTAGTATGSTGAPLVLQSKYANSTSSAATIIPITKTNGKIDSSFIDSTVNYNFSGQTLGGTTTIGTAAIATTTFSVIPTIPTTAPTTAGQVVALDSGAKLPAVDGSQLTNLLAMGETVVSASDTLRISSDVELIGSNTTYEIHKEISTKVPGVVRVKFDLAKEAGSGATVYGRIYLNGSAVGTERSSTSETYTTYSEDITLPRDTIQNLIQIYTKSSSDSVGQEARIKNFRIYFNITTVYGVVTQSS